MYQSSRRNQKQRPLEKAFSEKQETEIAKTMGGKVQTGSGGTRFGGGDVHTATMFIEAKTVTKDQTSVSIKKEWLEKAKQQAFEQSKNSYALAFRFGPDQKDYYVVDETFFKQAVKLLEEEK